MESSLAFHTKVFGKADEFYRRLDEAYNNGTLTIDQVTAMQKKVHGLIAENASLREQQKQGLITLDECLNKMAKLPDIVLEYISEILK